MARMASAERRSALILAAARVIKRDGVQGATTRAIVAEAKMSLASFHYAFRSRDEMMRDLIEFVVESERTAALGAVEVSADIRTTIRAGLQAYFDLLVSDPDHELVLFELLHYALRTPELEGMARYQYASYHAAVTQVVEAGAALAGAVFSSPSTDIARMIVTVTDGVTLAWLADRDTAAASRVLDFAADSLAALASFPAHLHHAEAKEPPR